MLIPKLNDLDRYAQNVSWLKSRGILHYQFWLKDSKSWTPRPLKSSWVPTGNVNEDGLKEYECYSVVDFITENFELIRVPRGFIWDGASIPFWAQWIIGKPLGDYALAALLHDWLYSSRIYGDTKAGRLKADQLFLRMMRDLDIAWWRRKAMYRAVRLGGSKAYHESDERNECKVLMFGDLYNPWTQEAQEKVIENAIRAIEN